MYEQDRIARLNAPTPRERLEALRALTEARHAAGRERPAPGRDVNNHIHTTYSFSPYSPAKAVWMAAEAGLATAGLMDHDSIGGAREFIEAGRIRSPEQRVALALSRMFWHGQRSLALSQEELAVLAGLARQTVNGILKGFERQGLVTLDFGRVGIRNNAGLTALLNN